MSNGNNFTPPPRVKNAFDIAKLRLSAPTPGAPGQKSSLQLTLVKNMPRFLIWTNDPAEKDDKNKGYGKITANLDPVALTAFWQIVKEVIAHDGPTKMAVANKGYKYFGRERSETPVVLNHLICGKNEDGVIWMMVSEKGRPQITFEFRMPEWHTLMDGAGNPTAPAIESRIVANGWIDLMGLLMTVMIADNYEEPPPRDQNGGGKGGYSGGNRGGGNGGYSGGNRGGNGGGYGGGAPAAGGDDDIPF